MADASPTATQRRAARPTARRDTAATLDCARTVPPAGGGAPYQATELRLGRRPPLRVAERRAFESERAGRARTARASPPARPNGIRNSGPSAQLEIRVSQLGPAERPSRPPSGAVGSVRHSGRRKPASRNRRSGGGRPPLPPPRLAIFAPKFNYNIHSDSELKISFAYRSRAAMPETKATCHHFTSWVRGRYFLIKPMLSMFSVMLFCGSLPCSE